MTALDTNLLVRMVVRDDPEQAERAAALVRAAPAGSPRPFFSRPSGSFAPHMGTVEALGRLGSMVHVELQDREAVTRALSWHAGGLDFADALHIACSREQQRFATFDGALRAGALRLGVHPPAVVP